MISPGFLAAAVPAVILTGIAKGGIGAAGGFAVPLLSLAMSPAQAAALMLPILLLMDVMGVYAYRGDWDRPLLAILLPAGLAGIGLGWATFRYLDDDWIRILLGVIACAFVGWSGLPDRLRPAAPGPWTGCACAAAAGFTSFVAHAGAPPLAMYLLPQRLPKATFVGTSIVFFAAINVAKVGPYLGLGLLDRRTLGTAAALLPVAIGGMLLGIWLRQRLSTAWFYRVAHALLLVTGLKLLWDGARGLLGR